MNGVVYSHFERRYKKYRVGIVLPVRVVDQDGLLEEAELESEVSLIHLTHVNLVFSNGLEVTHHDLSYQGLQRMIEKLKSLC